MITRGNRVWDVTVVNCYFKSSVRNSGFLVSKNFVLQDTLINFTPKQEYE
jgi:hypothetical protein